MAKELPYFKYFPSEWVTGDITLCSIEAQGLFVNLCCYYWMKNCSMSLANAKQRFSKYEAQLKELLEFDIIKTDEEENIIINFLDKQMNEFIDVAEKRAKAGAKGGKAKAKQLLNKPKAKSSNKEKDKEKKEDKEIDIIIPFDSEKFINAWDIWKQYKLKEHSFKYKSKISEQAALNKLAKLAGGRENNCYLIMQQSIENGYKGFFELNKQKSGIISDDYKQQVFNDLNYVTGEE